MQRMLKQHTRLSSARPISRANASRPVTAARPQQRSRVNLAVKAIFGLFQPKQSSSTSSQRQKELSSELLNAVSSKKAAEEIESLVKELQPFSVKSPVRSKLFFGTWDLAWSSKPANANRPRQILEEPNSIKQVTEFKSFGLLPGTTTQIGELGAIDNNNYEIGFDRVEVKGGLGGESRDLDVVYEVELLYLDDNIRITRTKAAQNGSGDVLSIWKRVVDGQAAEGDEEEEEEEEEEAPKKSGTAFFLGGAPKEGIATISEREVRKKLAAQEAAKGSGTKKTEGTIRLPGNLPPLPAVLGSQKVAAVPASTRPGAKVAANPAADAKAAREKAEQEKKAAAAAKAEADKRAAAEADRKAAQAKAEQEKKAAAAKAEAEKRAAAERKRSIQDQLEELAEELRDRQAASKEAAAKVKELERSNAGVLKSVSSAKAKLSEAEEDVREAEEAEKKAGEARAAAEAELKKVLAELQQLQSKLKQVA